MPSGLTSKIERFASDRGIDILGIASAEPFVRNGEVIDPRELLADARSIVVAGFYMKEEDRLLPVPPGRPTGRFSSAYNVRAFTAMEAHYFDTLRSWNSGNRRPPGGGNRPRVRPGYLRGRGSNSRRPTMKGPDCYRG